MASSQQTSRRRSSVANGQNPIKGKPQNKLRRGKRDGTPEKASTPNASLGDLGEDGQPLQEKRNVIINDEILAMQIKPDDLEKLHEPHPPPERKKTPNTCSVVVRKVKPPSEWDKPKTKTVTVARPAPPDAPIKPMDYSTGSGPRFDGLGDVIPHSILGNVEEFKKMAAETGELPSELTQPRPDSQQGQLTVKYEKKKTPTGYPKFESVEESNALKNWQHRMLERKRQQGYLSKLLNKPEDQLVMNQSDSYRKTQELRYIIDRTIASKDYGKGYRIGSEFWKQQEQFGDDITGLHMTLSQTEKGYPPPVEHVAVPDSVKKEKGTLWKAARTPFHKPWHRTPYLAERLAQLQPIIHELDPYEPDLSKVQVVGHSRPWSGRRPWSGSSSRQEAVVSKSLHSRMNSMQEEDPAYDPLASHPDVHPEPIFGPSLTFAGQPARWTGDSSTFEGQVAIEARVTFEAYSGKRTTSFLEIVNDGTTSIYYDWKKVPKASPFEIANPKVQRFYFNTSNGVILPGDTMKFPFVFKSPNAGVFSEQWQFETNPVVCGGGALVVTLRGVALQEDKYATQRTQLENELSRKQAEQVVSCILDDILEGIRSPERPCSPIDAYITEDEVFNRKNPKLNYQNELVSKLKQTYKEIYPEEEREDKEWDLSVENLEEMIMAMDETDEEQADKKQGLLQFVNQAVIGLSFPVFTPKQQKLYTAGYDILCCLVDNIVGNSMELRHLMGMPEKDEGDIPDEPRTGRDSKASGVGDGKKAASKGGGSSKPDAKKGAKESKSGGKGAGGQASKSGPTVAKTMSGKRPPTREKADQRSGSPVSAGHQSPMVVGTNNDPLAEAKYKEKLQAQAYSLTSEAMRTLSIIFAGVEDSEGGPKIPKM